MIACPNALLHEASGKENKDRSAQTRQTVPGHVVTGRKTHTTEEEDRLTWEAAAGEPFLVLPEERG